MAAAPPCLRNHLTETPVTARKNSFQKTSTGIVPVEQYFFCLDCCHQSALFFLQLINSILRFPLKRCKRLWDKAGNADGNRHAFSLWLVGIGIKEIDDLLSQRSDSLDVFHGLGGQAHHEIQFYSSPASRKSTACRIQDVIF